MNYNEGCGQIRFGPCVVLGRIRFKLCAVIGHVIGTFSVTDGIIVPRHLNILVIVILPRPLTPIERRP